MTSTTFFIIFVPILSILLLAINLILAPHNPYQEKDSAFECGFHSFLGQNRTQFSVSFFIFGLLFLLFDLEILLVYPYSVSSYTNDIYGLVIVMVFFVVLTLGFVFELGKNALTIDSRQTSSDNKGYIIDPTVLYSFFNNLQTSSSLLDLPKNSLNFLIGSIRDMLDLYINALDVLQTSISYMLDLSIDTPEIPPLLIFFLMASVVPLYFIDAYLSEEPIWPTKLIWFPKPTVRVQQPEIQEDPNKKECLHKRPMRRQLRGDDDFEVYKGLKCSGGRILMPNIQNNGSTQCLGCFWKHHCNDPSCSCHHPQPRQRW